MSDFMIVANAMLHMVHRALCGVAFDRNDPGTIEPAQRDRGAISLEQVLWFVAAGVSVAVIAGILWNQIRDQALTPVNPPSAP
jgi:hypothetical protein